MRCIWSMQKLQNIYNVIILSWIINPFWYAGKLIPEYKIKSRRSTDINRLSFITKDKCNIRQKKNPGLSTKKITLCKLICFKCNNRFCCTCSCYLEVLPYHFMLVVMVQSVLCLMVFKLAVFIADEHSIIPFFVFLYSLSIFLLCLFSKKDIVLTISGLSKPEFVRVFPFINN